ncbi:N-acetylglucosamine kinase [Kineococcus sp. DHX-1]|uniref:N-acetylglucosamine kinase n=1 Tax=Kineococcus sp. DHX-1 TaxID=3349638 RepID=UPI0036D43FCF
MAAVSAARAGVFLGVDGGGTKTALCVLTGEGEVLAELVAPSCYHLEGDGTTDVTRDVLSAAVTTVCELAGTDPAELTHAFFGLPAYGEVAADVPVLDALPADLLGHDRYAVDNDVVAGWAGSLGGSDGIGVVSGTGSIAYGRNGTRAARVGGWGEGFGDEGSGHWLGLRALQEFSRMSDGRRAPGPLLDVLREHLALSTDLELVDVVLNRWRRSRREVAALSRPLVEAARRGDTVASGVLEEAAAELVDLVVAVRVRAGFADDAVVPVSRSGGVLAVPEVAGGFARRLSALGGYDVRSPRFEPSRGAALLAARFAGRPLTEDSLARVEATVAVVVDATGGVAH